MKDYSINDNYVKVNFLIKKEIKEKIKKERLENNITIKAVIDKIFQEKYL